MLQERGGEERTLLFEMLNGMPVVDSPEEPATDEAVAEAEAAGAAAEAALEAESKEEEAPPAYEEEAPKEEGMFGRFMKKATAATNTAIAKAQEVDEQYKISEKANKMIDDGQKKLGELDKKYKVGQHEAPGGARSKASEQRRLLNPTRKHLPDPHTTHPRHPRPYPNPYPNPNPNPDLRDHHREDE